MLHTGLDPPLLAAAEDERVEAKQQMVLQDEQYFYDVVNNPTEIRDNRIEEEWPAGAKPVSKKIQYDDLYRAKRIEYQYTAGDDAWVSPHAADVDANGVDDSRRAAPSPHVSFAKRILWQTYQYDWLGNNIQTGDDANGFYDRSLGTITNGTANDGPYQLRSADIGADSLSADYDVTGNLEQLFVQRSGTCLPTGSSCSQSFIYRWDELGRLTHAKRWDGGTQVISFDTANAAANLEYKYAAGDERVLKTATDGEGDQVHSVYIYPSLELRRAAFESGDYTRNGATEVAYLFANGVRLARLVNEPLQSDPDPEEVGGLHVFFELGDHLGSTSVALDKATSELVERATYQAYGGAESDYRPGRWGSFREDYRFTGKEEDVEIGLTYFGKRFYNAALQRWASADPLEVHRAGASGEGNVYAYLAGRALTAIDPLGLCNPDVESCSEVATSMDGTVEYADGATSGDAVRDGLSTPNTLSAAERMTEEGRAEVRAQAQAEGNDAAVKALDAVDVQRAGYSTQQTGDEVLQGYITSRNAMAIAETYKGVEEKEGNEDNPIIDGFIASVDSGLANTPNSDQNIAWCASFVNYAVESAGADGPGTPRARAIGTTGHQPQNYGTSYGANPFVGGIAIFDSPDGAARGHTGFIVGADKDGNVVILGGNQGNTVNYSTYPGRNLIDVRAVPGYVPSTTDFQLPFAQPTQQGGSTR